MPSLLIPSLSLVISWLDIRTHRIPNILSLLFLLANLLHPHFASLGTIATAVTVMTIVFLGLRIGMGDIKLATALIATQGDVVLTAEYLNRFALVLSLAVALHLSSTRTIKGSIAFAPVLLIPFMTLYLDI